MDPIAAENNQANELREVHKSGSGVRMYLGCCDTYSTKVLQFCTSKY